MWQRTKPLWIVEGSPILYEHVKSEQYGELRLRLESKLTKKAGARKTESKTQIIVTLGSIKLCSVLF